MRMIATVNATVIWTMNMRKFLLSCVAVTSFAAAIAFNPPNANAVYWRGITAPTNIDIHGWPIIKEPPPSPCLWIRVNGYYVRQCVY
jgi:hypothetical protein